MSWSWYLYTTVAPREVVQVDAAYQAAIEAYLEDHDGDDELAEAGPSGPPPPRPGDVSAYRARFGEEVAPVILARLAACRATVSFDYVPGDAEHNPLQVSALRFFLEHLAPCVFDWGDLSLELGETTLGELARANSRGRLGGPPPKPRQVKPVKPAKRRDARPGELRAMEILAKVSRAAEDRDAQLDLSRAVARLPEPAQRYLALLVSEGVRTDADAALALALAPDAFQQVVEQVEAALRGL